jgi:hypothetical protein
MPKIVNVLFATGHMIETMFVIESTIIVVSSKKHCLLLICHVYM